jgi:phosphatidylethanolamine/phosphatidyl-N-methylethanolamine N-methyltransferase
LTCIGRCFNVASDHQCGAGIRVPFGKVDMAVNRSKHSGKAAERPDGHSPTAAVVARIESEVRATAGELIGKVQDARLKAHAATLRIEGDVRRKAGGIKRSVDRFQDEAKFIKNWVDSPLKLGAVAPSSPFLARVMAERIDPAAQGPVIEIGPGTGPVTEALIARGVPEDRLVLVEFNPEFCTLLRRRFPRATIVEGDAYALDRTLEGVLSEPAAAVVSSLPLTTRKPVERLALIDRAFRLMREGAPFVQFTYSVMSPIPVRKAGLVATVSDWVLRNLPPARVWTYRKPAIA